MNVRVELVLVPLMAMSSWAGSLTSQGISPEANWVVYMDQGAFSRTLFGPIVREELHSLGIDAKMQEFAKVFGFHPMDDVREVLLYGVGQDPEKGAVLFRGTFALERLLAPVRASPRYEEIPYRDIKLHGWFHQDRPDGDTEGRMMYGCLLQGDVVVMSAGLDALKRAIDVLEGVSPRGDLGRFEIPAPAGTQAFFMAGANGVDQMSASHGRSTMLKQTRRLGLAIGETGGQLRAELSLVASNGRSAPAIVQIAQGMLAYLTLAGDDQPCLAALARKVRFSCEQSVVRISVESSAKEVAQLFAEHRLSGRP